MNRLTSILFAGSLALNAAVGGTWAWQKAAPEAGSVDGQVCPGMRRQLQLSEDQTEAMQASWQSLQQSIAPVTQELHRHQQELIEALSAETTDPQVVDQLLERISSEQASLRRQVVEHILSEKQALTPAQRRQYFALLGDQVRQCRRRWGWADREGDHGQGGGRMRRQGGGRGHGGGRHGRDDETN